MEEQNQQQPTKKEIFCENCESGRLAVVWCEHCAPGTYYCKECDEHIHSGKATKNHARLGLKEKMKKPTFTKCTTHLEENKFYCYDCKTLICSVCKEDDHPQHKTNSIFKYGEMMKSDLKNSIANFTEIVKFLNRREKEVQEEILLKEKRREILVKKLNELDENLKSKKNEKESFIQQRSKVETSQVILNKSVEELGSSQLINFEFIELMKHRIKEINDEICPVELKLKLEKSKYAIGQSNKTYENYRPLTTQEILNFQNELLIEHEKNGGFVALDDFSTTNVFLTQTHWIGVTNDIYLQCGETYPGFHLTKGNFVKLFSYPNKTSFKNVLPLKQAAGANTTWRAANIPSFFILH